MYCETWKMQSTLLHRQQWTNIQVSTIWLFVALILMNKGMSWYAWGLTHRAELTEIVIAICKTRTKTGNAVFKGASSITTSLISWMSFSRYVWQRDSNLTRSISRQWVLTKGSRCFGSRKVLDVGLHAWAALMMSLFLSVNCHFNSNNKASITG